MSTLELTTLKEKTSAETVPVDTVIKGSAKAWVNFNGTGTVAIRDSFNVSSITDNGTGNYIINFTASFANANYCASSIGHGNGAGFQANTFIENTGYLTGSLSVKTTNNSAFVDAEYVCVSINGN